MRNGFVLIDKPKGITSFKLVMALRQKSGQKSVGFAGTLDPLATGLMVLALGEYTKLLPYLEASDKVYEVKIRLDAESDSGDVDGNITRMDPNALNKPDKDTLIKTIEQQFTGPIMQVPPRHSAIQIGGKRAYDMARRGEVFELAARPITIFSVQLIRYDFPELELRVHCSSGTYIRSLAVDLGKALGTGGYVEELRRTRIARIEVEKAIKIEELTAENLEQKISSGLELLPNLKQLEVNAGEYEILARGNFIAVRAEWQKIPDPELLALMDSRIVGILEFCENRQKLKFKRKFNIF
jgi:tRNA pseudouridine55 synthase